MQKYYCRVDGVRYERILYGYESHTPRFSHCPFCDAKQKDPHHFSCGYEECPKCGLARLAECYCEWTQEGK